MFIKIIINLLFLICLLGGCVSKSNMDLPRSELPVKIAEYTDAPITVDGRLDEPVWQQATAYPMQLSVDRIAGGQKLQEQGSVHLAWDDDYLYVGIDFVDSDIVAEGADDQMHHYQLGDVAEVFLKPADKSWYWELYVTPHSKKTSFFFPSHGRLGLPSCFEYKCELKVAAQVKGSLNDWQDKDPGWTAEMAVPVKDLTARGEKFGPDADWCILIGRYNYSRYLENKELSMCPSLSTTNFHLLQEYAVIKLER